MGVINSLAKVLMGDMHGSFYIDVFVIYFKSKNIHCVEKQLHLCLHKIQNWADENSFKFSKTKTACVHFVRNVNVIMILAYI